MLFACWLVVVMWQNTCECVDLRRIAQSSTNSIMQSQILVSRVKKSRATDVCDLHVGTSIKMLNENSTTRCHLSSAWPWNKQNCKFWTWEKCVGSFFLFRYHSLLPVWLFWHVVMTVDTILKTYIWKTLFRFLWWRYLYICIHGIFSVKFSMTSLQDYKMRTPNLHARCANHRTHKCVMTCDRHSTWA